MGSFGKDEEMSQGVQRREGRTLFGFDAGAYDEARPAYPVALWQCLEASCGLATGPVLEIGAGSGLATRELVARGVRDLTLVEPDRRFGDTLRALGKSARLNLDFRSQSFEECQLAAEHYRLAVSATAFHWIDPEIGYRLVARALVPGGFFAAWWNIYGNPDGEDEFFQATRHLLESLPEGPSAGSGQWPYALDRAARFADISATGAFESPRFERFRWTLELDAGAVRRLYATFSVILRLDPRHRESILDSIEAVAEAEFGGRVIRPMSTALYLVRRRKGGRG